MRRKLCLGRDRPSVFADATVSLRGENLAKDMFSGSSCPSEDNCAQSYSRRFIQRRIETEDPRESVPGAILLRLGELVLKACFVQSFSGGRGIYRRIMSRTVGADAQARRGADTCCCGGGCRVLSDLGM